MNVLDAETVSDYASWFRCLADPTRLQVLHTVACAPGPLTVGQIVDAVGRSQSTVSRHLHLLASERFVLTHPDGVRTLVRANPDCMTALPRAASEIMGVTT